jgi:hypothetical protein
VKAVGELHGEVCTMADNNKKLAAREICLLRTRQNQTEGVAALRG